MVIEFWVQGNPKGQPRPRAFSRGGHARVYDPGTAEGWKSCMAVAAREHILPDPIDNPVEVNIEFRMPRPKGHYGTGKNASVLKASAPLYHLGTPDCDNLAKAVLDALTTIRFWRDDSPVVRLVVGKCYENGSGPGARVRVEVIQ